MVAAPASGLAGLGRLAAGGSVDDAADTVRQVQGALTYAPRTTQGQAGLAGLGAVLEPVGRALEAPGKALGSAGFPLAGAALTAGLETANPETRWLKGAHFKATDNRFADLGYEEPQNYMSGDPGYSYHITNEERLNEIAQSGGLEPKPYDYGTDQSAWPDGSLTDRTYFSPTPRGTLPFAPVDGKPVLLRTRLKTQEEKYTGDRYRTRRTPASELEFLNESGQWEPMEPEPMEPQVDKRIAYHGTPHDFKPAVIVQNPETGAKKVIDAEHLDKIKQLGDQRWEKVADLPYGGFQTQRIGSGEGAQVYGFGHYFSTHPEIAKHYQTVLSRGEGKIFETAAPDRHVDYMSMFPRKRGEAIAADSVEVENLARRRAFQVIRDQGMDKKAALSMLATSRDFYRSIPSENAAFDRAIELVKGLDTSKYTYKAPDPGRFMKVEIPHESKMLDWDKPLRDQPTDVRIALEKVGIRAPRAEEVDAMKATMDKAVEERDAIGHKLDAYIKEYGSPGGGWSQEKNPWGVLHETHAQDLMDQWHARAKDARDAAFLWNDMKSNFEGVSGRQMYRKLIEKYGSPEEASAALHNAGIPGISYIGGTSDERNMVVFDDTLIHILEKGSADPKLLALLAGGSAAGVAAAQQNDKKPK
jgi:hypothetical protein